MRTLKAGFLESEVSDMETKRIAPLVRGESGHAYGYGIGSVLGVILLIVLILILI